MSDDNEFLAGLDISVGELTQFSRADMAASDRRGMDAAHMAGHLVTAGTMGMVPDHARLEMDPHAPGPGKWAVLYNSDVPPHRVVVMQVAGRMVAQWWLTHHTLIPGPWGPADQLVRASDCPCVDAETFARRESVKYVDACVVADAWIRHELIRPIIDETQQALIDHHRLDRDDLVGLMDGREIPHLPE